IDTIKVLAQGGAVRGVDVIAQGGDGTDPLVIDTGRVAFLGTVTLTYGPASKDYRKLFSDGQQLLRVNGSTWVIKRTKNRAPMQVWIKKAVFQGPNPAQGVGLVIVDPTTEKPTDGWAIQKQP